VLIFKAQTFTNPSKEKRAMKMKITNAEILNLFQALSQLNMVGNPKFTYTVAKNRASLKSQVEALQEAGQAYAKGSVRFQEFQKKSDDLIKKFSVDGKGKPLMRDLGDGQTLQRMIAKENMGDFGQAREDLEKEYNDVIVGMSAHQAGFQTILREEFEVDLRLLKLADVPAEGVNTQIMNQIFIFVDDEKADVIPLKEVKKSEQPSGPPVSA
jgi:hypothetical protein